MEFNETLLVLNNVRRFKNQSNFITQNYYKYWDGHIIGVFYLTNKYYNYFNGNF